MDQMQSGEIREKFTLMYHILHELRQSHNLLPAIEWARENRTALEERGSNLEFELCQLQFVWLFHGGNDPSTPIAVRRLVALDYARREFGSFQRRYLREIKKLAGAMVYSPNLEESPYKSLFLNPSAWSDVASSFAREFCFLLGLSADSPLYVAATAGAIALPTLQKLQTIMKEKRTEWTSQNELPVSPFSTSLLPSFGHSKLTPGIRSRYLSRRHINSTLSSFALFQKSRLQTPILP
jgi:hypothetical protein